MKKKRINLIIILVLLAYICGSFYYNYKTMPGDISKINLPDLEPREFNLTAGDYVEDFLFVYDILESHYPYFEINKDVHGVDWLANKDEYIDYISKSRSDNDFFNRMDHIIRDLNNDHSHMMDKDTVLYHYVIYYPEPKGTWRNELSKIYEKENVRRRYNITNHRVKNYVKKNFSNNSAPETNSRKNSNVQVRDIIPGDLGYIKISSFGMENIEKDQDILYQGIDGLKGYSNLIIDIRGNSGGSTSYWANMLLPKIVNKTFQAKTYTFIKDGKLFSNIIKDWDFNPEVKELIENSSFNEESKRLLENFDYYQEINYVARPREDSINFDGNIYLLVDESVYSSSESFASFCKETGLATLVGTKTGGDGIGTDPMQVDLPHTGYVMRFASDMGVTESGSINEKDQTTPDIEVEYAGEEIHLPFREQKTIRAVIKDANLEF